TWNVEEFRQTQFRPDEPEPAKTPEPWAEKLVAAPDSIAANEAIDPVQQADEHEWPTWTPQSADAAEAEAPEPAAPPKKKRKQTLRELFRSSRSTDAPEEPSHDPDPAPTEYVPQPADPIVAEFEAPEFAQIPEPVEIPAFED